MDDENTDLFFHFCSFQHFFFSFYLPSTLTPSPLAPSVLFLSSVGPREVPADYFFIWPKEQECSFKCPKSSLPNSARKSLFFCIPLYSISLSFIIYPLSFFLSHAPMQLLTMSEVKDSKDSSFSKIPQVCFLSLKPLTQSKLFWN